MSIQVWLPSTTMLVEVIASAPAVGNGNGEPVPNCLMPPVPMVSVFVPVPFWMVMLPAIAGVGVTHLRYVVKKA